MINHFTFGCCQISTELFKLVHEYRPEIKQEKKRTLLARADKKAVTKGKAPSQSPPGLQAEVNTVTTSVEHKKAGLVVTAWDVDPTELVVFLPALCYRIDFPY